MIGTLITPLLIAWGAVTVAFAVVMVWKSLAGFREADVIILDAVEAKQALEQKEMIARMQTLVLWAKILGIASGALLVILIAVSIYSNLAG
ncbi:MAG TPA: hypothetical protein VMU19_09870 [Bryobacteraceae bacterium]|nr:hypothetical protein [Bryobacteraceae bacterium]